MRNLSTLAAATLLAATSAMAGIETIEVKGEGANRKSAINDALVSAMQQVVGVDINSNQIQADQFKQSEDGFVFTKQTLNQVSFGTAGNATYRILSEQCSAQSCSVRLRANVEYDDNLARQKVLKGINANRRTLAIEPFVGHHLAHELTQAI